MTSLEYIKTSKDLVSLEIRDLYSLCKNVKFPASRQEDWSEIHGQIKLMSLLGIIDNEEVSRYFAMAELAAFGEEPTEHNTNKKLAEWKREAEVDD